jgi:hypothetical protein
MTGGLPVDLILFGMVAAFLVLRLRGVLGRRTGFERPAKPEARPAGFGPRPARPADAAEEPPPSAASSWAVPDPRSPPGQALSRISAADRSFAAGRFLDGAEGAFRMIVAAFATMSAHAADMAATATATAATAAPAAASTAAPAASAAHAAKKEHKKLHKKADAAPAAVAASAASAAK